jgi:hypothetical protein
MDATVRHALRRADRSLVFGLGGLAVAGVLTVSAWFSVPADRPSADSSRPVVLHVEQ